tara:strand:+ start:3061 stop:3405 length:345 start_codon:yes stop_codon:yes gene_type:complete
MRKITQDAARAFKQGKKFSRDNTRVEVKKDLRFADDNVTQLYLHGHCIAEQTVNSLHISLCGWPTMTTRERLNGLLDTLNIQKHLYQKKHEQYIFDRSTQTSEPFPSNGYQRVA